MVATAKDYGKMLGYSPATQTSLRRSQYLADALKNIGDSNQKITGGWGQLGANLLATALLKRAGDKADTQTLEALKGDQDRETAMWMGGIKPPATTPTLTDQQPPPNNQGIDPALAHATENFLATGKIGPQPVASRPLASPAYAPQDLDALTRMLATEAIGEGPEGMAAAGHVAMNRLKQGYGGAKSLVDVVNAPHQFEGMSRAGQVKPDDYAAARTVAEGILSGQIADPTGGAMNFLNPELQAQMGRQQPSWAPQGQGQRIGRHVFYGGQPGAPAPQGQSLDQAGPIADQPFQVAAAGQLQPGMIPSAPAVSPSGGGAAPVAAPPQAAAAGAWPTWKPTGQEIDHVQMLLSNPRTHDAGVQMAIKMRQKMSEPVEADITTINGRPFYVPKTPGQAAMIAIPVPPEAMSRIQSAEQLGVPAPAGTTYNVDPTGNAKEIYAPPTGYANAGDGGLAPQQGGPADPYRVQAPPSGYQLGTGQQYSPITNGPADPRSPANFIDNVGKLQAQIRPVVDQAISLKRNVDAVRTGYQQQNGPGDIAMINGLQKLVDDGVVREGDVALQLKGQGIAGGIAGLKGYMTSEGFFADPKIRTQILATANHLYGSLNSTYRDRVMGYQGMTNDLLGKDAFNYVFSPDTAASLGWTDRQPDPRQPKDPTPRAASPAATPRVRHYNPKTGKIE